MTDVPSGVRVERQAGALGAYVHGFDIARPLDETQVAFVRDVMNEHHVVCFRGQDISPAQHLAFSRRLGEIYVQPVVSGMKDYPEIVEVFGTHPLTEDWHSDSTHSLRPPRFSILVARTIPEYGNDTMFANQHLAYEALSERMRDLLTDLRAVHETSDAAVATASPRYAATMKARETAVHPVVRTHPDTNRKALYVNGQYTRSIEGMTHEESQPLLNFLYQHCGRPDFTWRHRWQPGDVLIWDNASVQHAVLGDMPPGTERYMNRTTTLGEIPF